MSKLFEQLKRKRGIDEGFLRPRYGDLTDPMVFPEMEAVAERIEQAVHRGEKVLIFGDYDVDGITASTVMAETLVLSGMGAEKIEIMLPDRFKDGYGMSRRAVERARDWGAKLVITVDTGSRSPEIIEELAGLGIDTIVTDHHECGKMSGDRAIAGLVALINPKRPDFPEEYRYLRDLAGVGVAFKVAQALVNRGDIQAGQEKWLLDLVLIGTICDNMPITRENRILSYYGMKVLAKTRRIGVKELMRRAGVRSLTSDAIGFQMGPRLNAAGRLASADLALRLVRTRSATEAAALAEQLEELNQQRKKAQQTAVAEIARRLNERGKTKTTGVAEKSRRLLDDGGGFDDSGGFGGFGGASGAVTDPVMIEVGEWHEGIIGIVAGQLVERYQRPAFVLTEVEKGVLKGSGRSFGDFNLAEALNFAEKTIIRGGGHAAAAGVSLKLADLAEFRAKINEFYRSLKLRDQERYLRQEADIEVERLEELNLALLAEMMLLEPFGEGNTKPVLRLTGVEIIGEARMGAEQNHLRLMVRDHQGRSMKLVAFFAPEEWLRLPPEDTVEIMVTLEKNEYQGVTSVEGQIVDIIPRE